MRSVTVTLDSLGRQKSLINTIESRIDARAATGDPVDLSLSLLRDEKRLYRRMLSQAPLDVLEQHAL